MSFSFLVENATTRAKCCGTRAIRSEPRVQTYDAGVDVFARIAAQRIALCDVLEPLSDTEAATASLCAGWRVREVVAHLNMPFVVSTPALVARLVRAGGSFNRVTDTFAKKHAARPWSELVETLREHAHDRFTPPGNGPEAPLADIIIHSLDISVPLDLTVTFDPEALDATLSFLVGRRAPALFAGRHRSDGLLIEATDSAFHAGAGPLVRGPSTALLLAFAGRRAGLTELVGDGVPELVRRLAPIAA